MRQTPNKDAIFQPISGAAAITGISTKAIRQGCREGTIPHIRVGSDYRINLPLWIKKLNEASATANSNITEGQ